MNVLVKLIGFPATLIHGDTMVLDRWLWLKGRLYRTNNNEAVRGSRLLGPRLT